MRSKQAGFSFFELMVVLAIMAVLASIAVPGIIGWLPKYRLGSGAQDLLAVMQTARMRAVKENTGVTIGFNFGNDTYTVTRDDGTTITTGEMPAGIDLTDGGLGASVHFNNLGFPNSGGSVGVDDNHGQSRVVELLVSGNSRIQ